MNNEELLAKYKALFPDNVEAIVVRKDDYDRLYGDLTKENIELKQKIERLNNIIKQQNTRNSRQRIANRKLQEESNLLKQIIGNDKKYSYGIRMGSDKECMD